MRSKRRGALLGELKTVLLEDVADFGRGAVLVVGKNVDDESDGALDALVGSGNENLGLDFARALLDGAFDVVVGHLRGLGLRDESTKSGVVGGIATLRLYDDGDFFAEFREDFTFSRVRSALRALDCRPVTMT